MNTKKMSKLFSISLVTCICLIWGINSSTFYAEESKSTVPDESEVEIQRFWSEYIKRALEELNKLELGEKFKEAQKREREREYEVALAILGEILNKCKKDSIAAGYILQRIDSLKSLVEKDPIKKDKRARERVPQLERFIEEHNPPLPVTYGIYLAIATNIAWYYLNLTEADTQKAFFYLEKVLEGSNRSGRFYRIAKADALVIRALLLKKEGRLAEAEQDCLAVLESKDLKELPAYIEENAEYILAEVLETKGDKAGALVYYKKILAKYQQQLEWLRKDASGLLVETKDRKERTCQELQEKIENLTRALDKGNGSKNTLMKENRGAPCNCSKQPVPKESSCPCGCGKSSPCTK